MCIIMFSRYDDTKRVHANLQLTRVRENQANEIFLREEFRAVRVELAATRAGVDRIMLNADGQITTLAIRLCPLFANGLYPRSGNPPSTLGMTGSAPGSGPSPMIGLEYGTLGAGDGSFGLGGLGLDTPPVTLLVTLHRCCVLAPTRRMSARLCGRCQNGLPFITSRLWAAQSALSTAVLCLRGHGRRRMD